MASATFEPVASAELAAIDLETEQGEPGESGARARRAAWRAGLGALLAAALVGAVAWAATQQRGLLPALTEAAPKVTQLGGKGRSGKGRSGKGRNPSGSGSGSGSSSVDCQTCKDNYDVTTACPAIYDMEAGNIDAEAGQQILMEAAWNFDLCSPVFDSQCEPRFNPMQLCEDAVAQLDAEHNTCFFGNGCEQEPPVTDPGITPLDCDKCTENFDLETACPAIYDKVSGRIEAAAAEKMIMAATWEFDLCSPIFQSDCDPVFNPADACSDKLKELDAQAGTCFFGEDCEQEEPGSGSGTEAPASGGESAAGSTDAGGQSLEDMWNDKKSQCVDQVGHCQKCVTSQQCEGFGATGDATVMTRDGPLVLTDQPLIYCCPRLKRCINIQEDGGGCSIGSNICPDTRTCREPMQEVSDITIYPFEETCKSGCPDWDPLSWEVEC